RSAMPASAPPTLGLCSGYELPHSSQSSVPEPSASEALQIGQRMSFRSLSESRGYNAGYSDAQMDLRSALAFALSLVLSAALTPVASTLARRVRLVVMPRADRWHRAPT